ncbi:MAG: toprim domain-containing protein [Rhodobacteraceae bacterium]|nr:toprim domain-containing protein [Paracoccaceae bacterium]
MNKLAPDTVRLTPEHLDEIRASVDWQAMFGGLGLRKAEGKSKPNDLWAFSPFHEEKTPSFHMGPGGLWFDFSIGEGGGAIELIQRLEGCNCFEAGPSILEHGWAHASIDLSQPVTGQRDKVRRSVTKAVTSAVTEKPEDETPANTPIRQDLITMCVPHPKLEERGISEETCAALAIGYLAQGRSPLKGRIVFQVADARVTSKSDGQKGRVILSHVGRAIADDADAKYLFYPGFHKSAELYGQEIPWLHEDAFEQTAKTGFIVLTEGPFDVAKAYEAGLRNVVGSFGASLSQTQAHKLADLARHHNVQEIRLVFDRDKAGREGAVRATKLLSDIGLNAHNFDWNAPVARTAKGPVHIPPEIKDLADFSTQQIAWLRQQKLL